MNNRGSRMDPCGTPVVMEINSDAFQNQHTGSAPPNNY